ncbi:MAG: hypothetical protein R3D89_12160 [Sphingomonadaceae bacterium]
MAVVISGQTAFIQTFNALSPFDTVSSVTPLDLDFVADGETELRLHTVFDNGTSIADSTVDLRLDETLSTTVEAYKVEFLI